MITPKKLSEQLRSRTEEKFDFQDDDEICSNFLELCPEALIATDKNVVRLRRKGAAGGRRTILICSVASFIDLTAALKWTGEVRDCMAGSESADLYLLLVGSGLDSDEAIRIESDELFCRKYVSRSEETVEGFLDRCFFTNAVALDSFDLTADPLAAALRKTAAEFPGFTALSQQLWREVLLSVQSGTDIVSRLREIPFNGEEY